MTIDNILKLAELGFTKQEIMQFMGETPEAIAPPADPVPADPAPAAPVEPAPDKQADVNAALMDAIQDLKKTIQASNIASTPQPVQQGVQEKADEVLLKMANM